MKSIYFLLLVFLCSCNTSTISSGWKKVYKNDASGDALYGNKSELIDAIRLGYPIRIGWGGNRVEHVAEAKFLTILEGEVFGQIDHIVGQAPIIKGDTIKMGFRTQNHWTKMAGTNGYTMSLMTDYMNDSIVGGGTDRYNATTWYVLYPSHSTIEEATLLWRIGSPNWEK